MSGFLNNSAIRCWRALVVMALLLASGCPQHSGSTSTTDSATHGVMRVLLLQDYNTRIVLLGTALLGLSGGIVGMFTLLRKRSLIGDVVGHSALPGICIAFIASQILSPGSGKNLPWMMGGALLSGILGALCVMAIDRYSRIRADAALAIVLSLFYGLGTALLSVIQKIPTASAAGLQSYLNGKTASLLAGDVWVFGICSLFLTIITLLLFKELTLLCFDDAYASANGWPTMLLDALLVGLVAGVTIVGMQTVGLILVVAILIIPAASARFWSDRVQWLVWIAAVLGAMSAALGTLISALAPRLAAGAVIVLSGSFFFLISLVLGAKRGLLWNWLRQRRLQRRIGRHDLLRAAYEQVESLAPDDDISESRLLQARFTRVQLQQLRSWSNREFDQLIRQSLIDEDFEMNPDQTYSLTPTGAALARRAVRNHRLWELYLITYADIAPSHADYDADRIEHILEPQVIRELEKRLAHHDDLSLPSSPHQLVIPESASDTENAQ